MRARSPTPARSKSQPPRLLRHPLRNRNRVARRATCFMSQRCSDQRVCQRRHGNVPRLRFVIQRANKRAPTAVNSICVSTCPDRDPGDERLPIRRTAHAPSHRLNQITAKPRCARSSFTVKRALPLSAWRASRIKRASNASSLIIQRLLASIALAYRLTAFFFAGAFRAANARAFLIATVLVLAFSFFLAGW